MRNIAFSLVIVLAVSASQMAAAEDIKGTPKDAERVMADFANCEVSSKRGREAALNFTREVAGTPSTYPKRLMKSSCLKIPGAKLRLQPELFRRALFPALYKREFGNGPLRNIAGLPQSSYDAEFDGTPQPEVLALRRFGDCVVQGNPQASHDVLISALYADAEKSALRALGPTLGACIGEAKTLRFSRSVLRGIIGEAMYKLSVRADATKAS